METLTEFLISDFMPHGHCYFWRPDILWTHVLSDAGIAIAYFCIPAILLYYLFKKRPQRIPFWWVLILFAAFIYLCGITHIIGIVTIWTPIYIVEGWLKAATAIVSIITAITLIPLVPKALTLRSAEELETVNKALNEEIEHRDRVQRKLHTTVNALKNSNQELEDITSITAHDLQAPLRRMISFTDALRSKLENAGNIDEEAARLLKTIEQNGLRMRQNLDDVLNFGTINAQISEQSSVDISEILKQVIEHFGDAQEAGDIDFEIGDMPVVETSAQVIHHTIFNLLDNSIKYRHPDRKLKITIRCEQLQDNNQQQWKFIFSDNGIGIASDQSSKVFKLFSRLHDNKQYPGNGVGLATVKKMLDGLGGRIWVDSDQAEGCSFHFIIPARRTE